MVLRLRPTFTKSAWFRKTNTRDGHAKKKILRNPVAMERLPRLPHSVFGFRLQSVVTWSADDEAAALAVLGAKRDDTDPTESLDRVEPHTHLQVPIPEGDEEVSLETCLERWSLPKPLDSPYKMASGVRVNAEQRLRFTPHAPYVIVQLIRNLRVMETVVGEDGKPRQEFHQKKNEKHVHFRDKISGTVLRLLAVVVHTGRDFSSGHYVCYARRKDSWMLYNDSSVTPVEE
eukprot:Hpha_TRINITY_DN15442_c0_g1::TRINITY_DN15442_c0_g1_i3::g.173012::m.173012